MKKFPKEFKKDVAEFLTLFIKDENHISANEHWEKIQKAIYESLKKNHLLKTKKEDNRNGMKLPRSLLDLRETNRNLFRRKVSMLRQEKWHNFIASIDSEEDRSSIWRKFKNSRGKKRTGNLNGDLKAEAENIKRAFENYSKPSFSPNIRERNSRHYEPDNTFDQSWNALITTEEVKLAIQNLKNSSPGPDGISTNIF